MKLSPDTVETAVQSIVLDKMRFAAGVRIPSELVHGGQTQVVARLDEMTDQLLVCVNKYFYGKTRDHELPPVPVTWWDHFKRDAIPTLTRWFGLTVNEKREVLRAGTVYPDLPQIQGSRFYYHAFSPMTEWDKEELN